MEKRSEEFERSMQWLEQEYEQRRQMREQKRQQWERELEEQKRRSVEEEARWREELRLENDQRMAAIDAMLAELELSLLQEREQHHREEPSLLSALVDFITGSTSVHSKPISIMLEEKRKAD